MKNGQGYDNIMIEIIQRKKRNGFHNSKVRIRALFNEN